MHNWDQRISGDLSKHADAQPMSRPAFGQSDIEKFAMQSYEILFGDSYSDLSILLMNIFKGKFNKSFENERFLDSDELDITYLKHVILQSGRLAFHYALE